MGKFDFIEEEIQKLEKEGLYASTRTVESAQDSWLIVDNVKVLNLCSNNYLGFANHPRLKEKVREAMKKFGVGTGGGRQICGTTSLHLELERKLAMFKHTEDAVVFAAGILANIGTIPALVEKRDALFSDESNHASIIDGCRLSSGQITIYRHKDMGSLKMALEKKKDARRKLIVTDGVFTHDGDLAPLPEIVELAQKYDAIVMVDDAHGNGVLGDHGRGIVDHFALHGKVDIEMGTMSKAFGVIGGYIVGNKKLIDLLRQRARPYIFSTAPTPIDMAALITVIDILEKSDEPVTRLWNNTRYFKDRIMSLGFDTGHSETPIIPVILGKAQMAQDFKRRLFEEKVLVQAVVYPVVPKGNARLRIKVSATHKKEDLDFAVSAFEKIGKATGVLC